MDSNYLQSILSPHASGVQLLAAPDRVEDAESISAEAVGQAVALLRADYAWVVADLPRSWDEMALHTLELAEQILLVTLPDVPALNHARKNMDLLERLGLPTDKVVLMLNRAQKGASVSNADLARFLDRKPDLVIPNDFPAAQACVDAGVPIWESGTRSTLGPAFDKAVRSIQLACDPDLPAPEPKSSGFRGLLKRVKHGAS